MAHLVGLFLPASLVLGFTLLAGAATARRHHQAATPLEVPVSRVDVAAVRARLKDLGRRRLDGEIDIDEFLILRDRILLPVTQPRRASQLNSRRLLASPSGERDDLKRNTKAASEGLTGVTR